MAFKINTWLTELGLDQYIDTFAQNDVDGRVLPLLAVDDLKELGVSLGHRKIILAAIQELQGDAPSLLPPRKVQTSQPEPSRGPPAPVDDATVSPASTPGAVAERRHLTVLFADLVDSTKLSNQVDPEAMRLLLQQYQDAVAGAVSRYGGYVAKYLGDGLLVFFGWPTAYEDHAVRAVKAGLDAVQRVNALKTPEGAPLAVRMGVASGEVIVGDTVGENTYEEGAMTGLILNLAARIQTHAPPNTIVLPEEETEASLRRIFEFSSLGQFDLKGFDTPRRLLQVVAERSAESRFRAAHRDATNSALVGRNLENSILQQAWERAQRGKGEVVLIQGEAGIGKSRLSEAFLSENEIAGTADIIRLNCSPYLTSSPFHPVAERISQDAGVEPGFDDDRVLEHVQAMLATRAGLDLDQVLPVFAALVAPRSSVAQQILEMSPQEQRDITIQTLIDTVKARANVCPVILFAEDAHWIDPSTNALIDRFRAICADLPILVMITHRPGWELERDDGDAHVQTLRLRRFDSDDVADLVQNISGHAPDKELVQTIVEKTDGIPLFVEELTRAIVASGETGTLNVPSSLKGALMARLDAVSSDAKQIALTGSVIGREFEPAILQSALNKNETEILPCLEELCKSGLIYESGHSRGHFVFRHALIRDTAYQSMLATTRREQHAQVAAALTRLRSAEIDRRPELVAHHLTAAEDWAAAFQRWRHATEIALARSASHEAMANSKEALKAAQELGDETTREVIIGKILVGRGYDSVGRLPEGIAILKEALNAAREAGEVEIAADATRHFADSSMMAGELHDQAIKHCEKALDDLPEQDEVRRCKLMSQLARTYMFTGQFTKSAEYSQKCLKLAAKLGDLKSQFHVMMARFAASYIARQEDEVRNWRENLEAMHKVAEQLGTIDQGRDRTLSLFAGAEMADRQLMDRSLALLSEISAKDNHRQLYWVQTHARAMVATLEGDFESAETYANEALKIGRQTHGKHVEGVFGVQMFTIRREQGRLHEVAPVIKRLMTENAADTRWKPGFGVIAAELGFLKPAERILNELAETGFAVTPDAMYSTTLSYLADICVAVKNEDHAKTLFTMLLPYEKLTITAGATTACTGAAARRLGNLAALTKDWEISDSMFEQAIEIDTRMGALPWLAHSKAAYAAALQTRGRSKDAERAFQLEAEALAISRNLGMISLRSRLEGLVM
jgi:class 3 adenylate cyclase/tetratricopeptide (TPR) repeat protein